MENIIIVLVLILGVDHGAGNLVEHEFNLTKPGGTLLECEAAAKELALRTPPHPYIFLSAHCESVDISNKE